MSPCCRVAATLLRLICCLLIALLPLMLLLIYAFDTLFPSPLFLPRATTFQLVADFFACLILRRCRRAMPLAAHNRIEYNSGLIFNKDTNTKVYIYRNVGSTNGMRRRFRFRLRYFSSPVSAAMIFSSMPLSPFSHADVILLIITFQSRRVMILLFVSSLILFRRRFFMRIDFTLIIFLIDFSSLHSVFEANAAYAMPMLMRDTLIAMPDYAICC